MRSLLYSRSLPSHYDPEDSHRRYQFEQTASLIVPGDIGALPHIHLLLPLNLPRNDRPMYPDGGIPLHTLRGSKKITASRDAHSSVICDSNSHRKQGPRKQKGSTKEIRLWTGCSWLFLMVKAKRTKGSGRFYSWIRKAASACTVTQSSQRMQTAPQP